MKAKDIYIPDGDDYPERTDDGRAFRSWVDPKSGDTIREYEDTGVIYNYTRKNIIRGAITKDNAHELQAMSVEARKNTAIESARKGLLRGVSATEIAKDWGIAWEFIVAAQAELALTPDMGNASTRAAEFIMRAADLDPKHLKENVKLTDGRNSIDLSNLSPERMDYILEKLRNREVNE